MITRLIIFLVGIVIVLMETRTDADLIVLKKDSRRVFGLLEEESADGLIRITVCDTEGHLGEFVEYSKSEIGVVIRTVEQKRLQKLTLGSMPSYRDYAEELASYRDDPMARKLAFRLCCICIDRASRTGDDELAASAGRILISLATSNDQRGEYEQAAFLFAGVGDANELISKSPDSISSFELELVRQLRKGQFRLAAQRIEDFNRKSQMNAANKVTKAAGLNPGLMKRIRRCIQQEEISDEDLLDFLNAEVFASSGMPRNLIEADLMSHSLSEPVLLIEESLADWAGINPRASIYNRGEWIEPVGRDE